MAVGSGIEWTEATWNPLTGCDKISPGCKHCYAERMSARLKAMGQPNYAQTRSVHQMGFSPHCDPPIPLAPAHGDHLRQLDERHVASPVDEGEK